MQEIPVKSSNYNGKKSLRYSTGVSNTPKKTIEIPNDTEQS